MRKPIAGMKSYYAQGESCHAIAAALDNVYWKLGKNQPRLSWHTEQTAAGSGR